MTTELAKVYKPKEVERKIYKRWIAAGSFNAEPDGKRAKYCIVIPPPNVTDRLHVGHALNNALQDVLIRYKRMQQLNTLWMPGTDHAGIATQTVVEKRILTEEGKRRTDFEREHFVERIEAWKNEYESRILEQLKMMGCSCDWRRTRFTMDDICARAVRATFFKLFADGLIYRGKRLVNWDPATQTVLADDEVEHETVQGHFWYLRYPLEKPVQVGGKTVRHVTVATTRPETMLGDTGVAINPADPRAAALVGKMVRLPIVGRLVPIIPDELVVLPNPNSEDEKARFSTGFLKVTPGHDPNDWEIGQRHGLEIINVMAPDGTISDKYGWDDAKGSDAEQFLGMDRFEAREGIVEWFRQAKLLADVREYVHEVGHSYRSHVPIEPYLSDQWYIAVKKPIPQLTGKFGEGLIEGTGIPVNSLAGMALKPLLEERLKFTPPRYARTYQSWLENLRDWPISRQLWWGHRIPIWSRAGEAPERGQDGVIFREIEGDEGTITYACVAPGQEEAELELEAQDFQRDPDVLDTWFSSALWPFSTMGWPEQTPEMETFYPGDLLCTAREIITLWVSRMVMMGQYCAGDIPFTDVLIHAMVQDGEGRKMSKSLGNGIDPLDIIDSHGADAMRFTLVSMATQTQDVRMPVEQMALPDGRSANTSPKFDIGRNLCNKLWNASRFVLMNLTGVPAWGEIHPKEQLPDRWILSRINATIRDATSAVEAFRFNELSDTLYHFMWDDFCDWYLEIAKIRINSGENAPKAILAHCLDVLLRLLHPICPFVTEEIWGKLNEVCPNRGTGDFAAEPMLVRARWPQADAAWRDDIAAEQFALLRDLIRLVRNVRTEHNVPPSRRANAAVEAQGPAAQMLRDNVELLKSLAGLDEISIEAKVGMTGSTAAALPAGGVNLYVLDIIDPQAERERLAKQAETLKSGISGIEAKLSNENFVSKAPAEVVKGERERLAALKHDLEAITKSLDALTGEHRQDGRRG